MGGSAIPCELPMRTAPPETLFRSMDAYQKRRHDKVEISALERCEARFYSDVLLMPR